MPFSKQSRRRPRTLHFHSATSTQAFVAMVFTSLRRVPGVPLWRAAASNAYLRALGNETSRSSRGSVDRHHHESLFHRRYPNEHSLRYGSIPSVQSDGGSARVRRLRLRRPTAVSPSTDQWKKRNRYRGRTALSYTTPPDTVADQPGQVTGAV